MGRARNQAEAKDAADEAPEGYVTMYAPHEDVGGLTIDNEPYEVVDGAAYIAHEHVEEARIHGFTTKRPE